MAKVISCSLPEELVPRLDLEAGRQRRSRSFVIAEAVRGYLAEQDRVRDAAFGRGRDLLLLDGLRLDPTHRALESEELFEEAVPFAYGTEPFTRVLADEAAIAAWKAGTGDLLLVKPPAGRVAEAGVRTRIARVCGVLNGAGVRYVLIGGAAANLHGVVRATKDIDVLIEATVDNAARALEALARGLTFGIAAELDAREVARAPFTIVGDTPRVDLLTVAWSVRYPEAADSARDVEVEGVSVPLAAIPVLIQSKGAGRLRDLADIEELRRLVAVRGRGDSGTGGE
jgi:predicted nucleotidyltransferase